MEQNIQIKDEDQQRRILLQGNLDAILSPDLEALLDQQQLQSETLLIIDLESVSSVTADGVRVLLNAFINKAQYTGGLVVANPNDEVKQLMITVGLEALLSE